MSRARDREHHFLYRTVCVLTGRYYLGAHSTNNLDDGYLGSGRVLRASVRKYGVSAHTRVIVETCMSRELLMAREREVVHADLLRDPLCMNLTVGGEGGPTRLGHVHTPETKERIRQSLMGHVHSAETIARIGATSAGRNAGVPLTEDHRRKIGEAHKGRVSPLRGVPRPPEVVEKMRMGALARQAAYPRPKRPALPPVPADVVRARLSEAGKKAWANPDTRRRWMEAMAKVEDELTFYCDNMRHLVCVPYTVHNLHRMAKELSISRHWWHNSKNHAHYDIPKRRVGEVTAKCRVVSPRDILAIIKGTWVPPADGVSPGCGASGCDVPGD